jgi:hypothetical protein
MNPEEGQEGGSGAFTFLLIGGAAAFGLYLWSRKSTPATSEPIVTESEETEAIDTVVATSPAPSVAAPRATTAPRIFGRFSTRIAEGQAQVDPRTAIPGTRFEPGPPGGRR